MSDLELFFHGVVCGMCLTALGVVIWSSIREGKFIERLSRLCRAIFNAAANFNVP